MTVLREGELILTLPDGVQGRQFDDECRSTSQMHAVDWIIEWPQETYFVEVKDPVSRRAGGHADGSDFVRRFQSGRLIPNLVGKFRDSFLCEWACERAVEDVSYFIVVAGVESALLLAQADRLRGDLPVGMREPWTRPLAHRCAMFNVDSWNREFPDLPLTRDPY